MKIKQANGYIKTVRDGNRYKAVFYGGRPVVNTNRDPITRSTRKEVQDYIRLNWNEIRDYN